MRINRHAQNRSTYVYFYIHTYTHAAHGSPFAEELSDQRERMNSLMIPMVLSVRVEKHHRTDNNKRRAFIYIFLSFSGARTKDATDSTILVNIFFFVLGAFEEGSSQGCVVSRLIS